ncbi:MAG: hypothetical protein IKH11_01120 [Bacteroidales bacterium]|nr:hypothetical protein [Bacteroidales bacterium]
MKKIVCIIFVLLACFSSRAQSSFNSVKEIGIGFAGFNPAIIASATSVQELIRTPGVSLYGEYRIGITNWFAVGAQLDLKVSDGSLIQMAKDIYNQMRYFQESLRLLAEIKFLPRKTVRPYVGFAAGIGLGHFKELISDPLNTLVYCDLAPRLGVQFGNHVRVSAQFSFTPSVSDEGVFKIVNGNFTSVGMNIGWAF